MLTLQILDSGQTFFRPLEGRALTLGSADDVDVRLHEEGVAPRHARIEPLRRQGRIVYKIVDLDSPAGTKVNGAPVAQVLLELGDRVELGRAVLVLGRSVSRPATVEDVLETPAPRRVLHGSRRRRAVAAASRPGRSWVWPLALAAGAAVALGIAVFAGGEEPRPASLSRIEELQKSGRFETARQELARLRASWVEGSERRERIVADAEAALAAVERAVVEGRQRILADSATSSYAELNARLQEQERQGATSARRQAARILRGRLRAILDEAEAQRARLAAAQRSVEPATGQAAAAGGPQRQPAPSGQAEQAEAQPAPPQGLLADIARLRRDGLYAQALDAVRSGLAEAGSAAEAEPYRQLLDALRADARREMEQLVQQSRELEKKGELEAAVAHLAGHAHRFPGAGDLSLLHQELEGLRQRLLARSVPGRPAVDAELERTRQVSLELVAGLLAQVRESEQRGDFAGAAVVLRRAAEMVRGKDPRYAESLLDKAVDHELIAAMGEAVASALSERDEPVEVALRDGRSALVTGVAGGLLRVETAEGDRDLSWPELPLASVERLLDRCRVEPRAWLGAAVLGYRNADPEAAEALLVRALKADASLQADIDGVLTRGRRDRRDPRGYRLVKGEFVSAAELEARERAKKLERRLASVLRQRQEARDRFLEEILAEGPETLDALLIAFRRQYRAAAGKLADLPIAKQYQRLLAQRQALDEARRDALALIFDEQRYFYPYKPPAVSAEKAAEYHAVQRQVDDLVDRVRAVWQDDRIKVRIPAGLAGDLERVDWLARVLADFGERDEEVEQQLVWVRTLPRDKEPLTIRNFCRTVQERRQLDLWQQIDAYNERQMAKLNAEERQQVAITNEYRRMFGHRPLAVNLAILEAARGHAREMADLGYFGHFSPTGGMKTPFDRMRKAGYAFGVSENIARNGSPLGAHVAWLHSSGHHRNLLNPSHTEFAVGVVAGHYVQNFGRGEEFAKELGRR